jgi:hypothetical protein
LGFLMMMVALAGVLGGLPLMASPDIQVYVDGRRVDFPDQPPVLVNQRTLVPLRFVTEAMEGKVEWLEAENRINIYTNKDNPSIPDPIFTGWSSTEEGIGGVYLENVQDFQGVEMKAENLTYPEMDRMIVKSGPERRAVTLDSQEWRPVEGRPMSIVTLLTGATGENLIAPRVAIPLGSVVEYRITFRRRDQQRVAYTALIYGDNDHVLQDGIRTPRERL